jgi:hypothetical protein
MDLFDWFDHTGIAAEGRWAFGRKNGSSISNDYRCFFIKDPLNSDGISPNRVKPCTATPLEGKAVLKVQSQLADRGSKLGLLFWPNSRSDDPEKCGTL